VIAADEIGVLALPAKPGRLAERLFHHRRGIDENLDADLAQAAPGRFRHQPAGQRLQGLLDRIVIVLPLRIDRNPRALRASGKRQRIGGRGIGHAQRDHALRLGPQPLRRAAMMGARGHPFHLAVPPLAQPLFQPAGGERVFRGGRDPAGREAQTRGFGAQIGKQGLQRAGRSGRNRAINHARVSSSSRTGDYRPQS
jgi:hypothetical protein